MVWGAFTNSSTGMKVQSDSLGTISQNIANVNTTGYKEAQTLFKTTLSETLSTASGQTPNFGVKSYVRNLVDNQGMVSGTDNWSDIAINGKGFFIVSDTMNAGDLADPSTYVTRAGDFQTRAVGDRAYLTTSAGMYVMGWMADASGTVDTSGNIGPMYLEPGTLMPGNPTSTVSLTGNLPANATLTNSSDSQEFTITDNLGDEKTVSVAWSRTDGDVWQATFSVKDGSGTVVNDVVDVTLDGNGNVVDPTTGTWDLVFDWGGPTTNETVTLSGLLPNMNTQPSSVAIYDQNGDLHTVSLLFERNDSNQWYLRFQSEDGTISDLTSDTATASSAGYSIPVEFDGDGKLISPTSLDFTATWDDTNAGTNTVSLDLSGITQYTASSGKTSVATKEQDGYGKGTLEGVEFTATGELSGQFSNGETRTLMKIAVASFVSPNLLEPVAGTLFRASAEAGEGTISAIEALGGANSFSPNSVENSTIDLEDQFTRMIVTQKAYSTNATVFKTADEMLSTARDLKS
ncbi:MAG: flagellar hook protein FlgE [Magnetospirillum sp.]